MINFVSCWFAGMEERKYPKDRAKVEPVKKKRIGVELRDDTKEKEMALRSFRNDDVDDIKKELRKHGVVSKARSHKSVLTELENVIINA